MYQRTYVDPVTKERRTTSTWSIQFCDRLGRNVREHGFTTEAIAERELRRRLTAKEQGRDAGPAIARTTFEDLRKMIVDDYAANGHRSADRLKRSLAHLGEFFEGERAARITEDRVTAYVAKRREEGAAAATINAELAALRRAFRLGARAGKVGRRPDIVMLRLDNARKGFFEEPQFRAVLQHLEEPARSIVVVAYYTGWRVTSEILTREWKHVDLDAGWIRLEPGETKNRRGRQFPLDIAPELRRTLDELHRQHEAEKDAGRIIPWVFHRGGKPVKSWRTAWATACVKAGLGTEVRNTEGKLLERTVERIPHDFRRTAVRNLERAGVPRSAAMAMVGHLTESIYRRYAIVDEASLREAAVKMATWIQGRK